jgi:glyoxylase-like metal-dependent hydrolase (beta-lactamase superfamily II)
VLVVGFPTGAFQANCYLVAPAHGEACVIVDPGQDAVEAIDEAVNEYQLSPVAVLLTHGHFDHTYSVAPVCDGNDIPAWIHPEDREMLSDPMKGISAQGASLFGGRLTMREPREVRELADGTVLELAGLCMTVDHTPGHTRGSVTFRSSIEEGGQILFAGDTLFAGSIGRTDLPGGDTATMMQSLRIKLLTLDDQTVVLPGHGPSTTIGKERASNPFLAGLAGPVRGQRGL